MIGHILLALLQGVPVQGVVRDSSAGAPLPGVVVQLLDSAGNAHDRRVTNLDGRYRVVPSSAVTRVQFLKLGYRPREVRLAATDSTLDVAMVRLPTLLTQVATVANRSCPRRRDSDRAFGLWQQARAGLLQTVVAREHVSGSFTTARFNRTLDNDDEIAQQTVRLKSAESRTAFGAARGAADFVRLGFIQEDGLYAPDADVLLHPDFQGGYCFSIADRDRSRPTQVGLRFAPPRILPRISQIDGTLWIDTAARVIKDVQFRYLGFDPYVARRRPGGRLTFRTMTNGMVVIDEWTLRGVALDGSYQVSGEPDRARSRAQQNALRRHYRTFETGGELLHARWTVPDSAAWDAPNASLVLRLTDKRGRPVAGRLVLLDSTDYRATSDSSGRAVIRDLLPGPYQANVEDTLLAALGGDVRGALKFRIARGRSLDTTLKVTTLRDLVEDACGDKWADTLTRVLVARGIDHDGKSLKGWRWQTGDGTFGFADEDGVMSACIPKVLNQETREYYSPAFVTIALSEDKSGKGARMAPVTLTDRTTVVRLQLPPPDKP